MRFIHTSDWHLGHRLYGLSRFEEQKAFLEWLLEQIEHHQIDALIVAGDIFDTHNPSAQSTRLYYQFLHRLNLIDPHVQTVVIAGNHDSAQRLDAPRDVLQALNVHVVGSLPSLSSSDWDDIYIPLKERSGEVTAWVAAVPFLRSVDLPLRTSDPEERLINGVREVYQHALSLLQPKLSPNQGVILTGHCQMSKSVLSQDSERKMPGFGDHTLPSDIFSPDEGAVASYVALGHLHLAQSISNCDWIRYSGSPLPFSVSERDYPHQILLVDLEGDHLKEMTPIHVPQDIKREMICIPNAPFVDADGTTRKSAPLVKILAEIKALDPLDESVPEWRRPLLQIKVFCDTPDPTVKSKIIHALRNKHPRLTRLHNEYPERSFAPITEAPTLHLADIDPDDIFRARWRDRRGNEPSDEVLSAFQELRNEARVALNVDRDQEIAHAKT